MQPDAGRRFLLAPASTANSISVSCIFSLYIGRREVSGGEKLSGHGQKGGEALQATECASRDFVFSKARALRGGEGRVRTPPAPAMPVSFSGTWMPRVLSACQDSGDSLRRRRPHRIYMVWRADRCSILVVRGGRSILNVMPATHEARGRARAVVRSRSGVESMSSVSMLRKGVARW